MNWKILAAITAIVAVDLIILAVSLHFIYSLFN